MHILCPTFGYCVKHGIIQLAFYVLDVNITLFYSIFSSFMYFFVTMLKKWKDKGNAYNGPIML